MSRTASIAVKIIALLVFVFGAMLAVGSIYTITHFEDAKETLLAAGGDAVYGRIMLTNYLFALVGLTAITGAVGLFLKKKIGFYLTLFSIVLFWITSSLQYQGFTSRLNILIISAIILVYLLYQRKLIMKTS